MDCTCEAPASKSKKEVKKAGKPEDEDGETSFLTQRKGFYIGDLVGFTADVGFCSALFYHRVFIDMTHTLVYTHTSERREGGAAGFGCHSRGVWH